ncbi:MAG: FAD-dependent oxidoreductase, partial [Candidatus Aminicenantes bacterium]|nr:FAD-dependent oxidoreductase [Gammaproteobacteria bacterium]NIO61500.1 FAD-dependent oxidoreductase [Gammaproteobacteria bacterium]NIO82491.1 FAD-dependent oxidoreductase [Candidatus Aminicenantes bacterium]NIT23458.1 FAD-dependent oxidoreductase [Candidatus Aminicenantes bacterium]
SVKGLNSKGPAITGVDTGNGELKADAYVLAAGSYSTVITRSINLSLPIKPVKGYSITLEMNDWQKSPKVPLVDYSL